MKEIKKKLIRRGLLGIPLGIAVGHIIAVIISLSMGDSAFHPAPSESIAAMQGELNAVILQTLLCGIMGMGFAMASVIWEIDSWSLAKQSGVYFAAACLVMFPISYFANWMPHSAVGILSYVGIFAGIFLFTWLAQYLVWKRKIRQLNQGIRGNSHPE